jgi:hypothetical protein
VSAVASACCRDSEPDPVIPSLPMGAAEFRTVFAGVRPARIAVLIDQDDQDWQETCRRIIESLTSTWGGKYCIIVPTDGTQIDPVFWGLLEAYDPDYICEYDKTCLDLKIAAPEKYGELLEAAVIQASTGQTPEELRDAMDRALRRTPVETATITPELKGELKARLAPFFVEDEVTELRFSAREVIGYPLTALSAILPHCEHAGGLVLAEVDIEGVPPLWVESFLGASYHEETERIEACGVVTKRVKLTSSDLYQLTTAQLANHRNEKLPDYVENSPFEVGMAALSLYSLKSERSWETPVAVVVGQTLKDFALYFDLSRMRTGVSWLLPSWLDKVQEQTHAGRFANAVLHAAAFDRVRSIDFVSTSHGKEELERIIDDLHAVSVPVQVSIKTQGRIGDLNNLLASPRVVFNTDNFATQTTLHVLEGKAAGFFPTPKPKGFTRIVPYDHRWITELRVDGLSYPRHHALGAWLIRHTAIGTQEARTGKQGLCYFCPNVAYFGGDVDTILLRPELHMPNAEAVFKRLAESAGLSCKLSDKGFFSRDVVLKMGGLEYAAALVREPRHFAVLQAYLADKTAPAAGLYLASDSRRYLSLADVSTVLADEEQAVSLVDTLLSRKVLHRGTVLKCQYCRTADWFSTADLADEFACKRCGRRQVIQSGHTLRKAEPVWYYQLDEIAYLGLRNDMHGPLLALDHLRKRHKSFSFTDELEIWKPNEETPFIEIDICCICEGVLTIGEAKTTERIEGGGKAEVRSLTRYKEVAALLGARRFVLATTEVWSAQTLKNATAAFVGTNIEIVSLGGAEIFNVV